MNIAVLGAGGREHAIVWKLAQSVPQGNIFTLPGNGGIPNSVPIDSTNFEALEVFCKEKNIELIVVGPEAHLVAGIVDHFAGSDIKVFGPDKEAAAMEGSKIWAKEFMAKYGVATADFWVYEKNIAEAKERIKALQGDLVMKYDGLAGGKGVYVCSSEAEALEALEDLQTCYGDSAKFIIEKKLSGAEISIIGFTDGKDIQMLMPSQDHKQLHDGDTGPNTGGMGAYCPPVFYDDKLMADIREAVVNPTLQGLQGENLDFKGIVYFGIMIAEDGPQLLEYNVRLGDPETEIILPAMKSDLLQLILSCFDGSLAKYQMEFHDGFFVDVVLASGGYPKTYEIGYEIQGLNRVSHVLIFHAGTAIQDEKLVSAGGRVLNVVANGKTLGPTIEKAYRECSKITFQDMYYRKDIGKRDLR